MSPGRAHKRRDAFAPCGCARAAHVYLDPLRFVRDSDTNLGRVLNKRKSVETHNKEDCVSTVAYRRFVTGFRYKSTESRRSAPLPSPGPPAPGQRRAAARRSD